MAEVEESAAPVAKKKSSLLSRQLQAIKRQNTDTSATKQKVTVPTSDSTVAAISASATATTTSAVAAVVSDRAANGAAGSSRLSDLSKSVRLKIANNTAARRLGLPLKGEIGGGMKRSLLGVGRLQGFAAKAFRAAAVAAAPPAKLRSDTLDTLARAKRRVPPVVRLHQAAIAPRLAVRRIGLRSQGTASRALAALVNVSVEQSRRARPRVRLPGIAGALLPVKKQEESDEEVVGKRQLRSHGMASKVITVAQPRERRVPPVRPAPRAGGGFGYGQDNSDVEEVPAVNGQRAKRPLQSSGRLQARARARAPRDLRSGGIVSAMLGHLNSAKRQLSDERTGIKVKEEAHWEPKEEEEEVAEEAPVEDEEEDEEDAPVAPPPRKRAKLRKDRERQKMAKAQAAEMRALQRRLETHYSSMKNFIRTRAEPTIFYLPAKHNAETQKQLEETRSAINHKITSLKVHLQSAEVEEVSAVDSDEE